MTPTMIAPSIVQNFDSQAEAGRKLAIICSRGNLDMADPGNAAMQVPGGDMHIPQAVMPALTGVATYGHVECQQI